MNPEALSKQLATIKSRDEFRELFKMLHHWSKPQLFAALFPIASDYKTYPWPAYSVATDLLVALEPDCPFSCKETLERLGHGQIEASLQRLVFYLVAQFGRHQVIKEAEAFLADPNLSEQARQGMTTVRYWVRCPASRLASGYVHLWEKWDDHAA